jgi:lipoprotein
MKKFIFAGLLALFVMSCNGNTGAAVSDSVAGPVGDSTAVDSVSADSVVVDSAAVVLK